MEKVFVILRLVAICVVVVVVVETTGRAYRLLFPVPAREVRVIVEHHLTADGVDGTFDITTDVISVALGVEEATRKAMGK
jgi:hypothetical protein